MATIGRAPPSPQLPTGTTMKGKPRLACAVPLALLTGRRASRTIKTPWSTGGWTGFTRKRTNRASIDVTDE